MTESERNRLLGIARDVLLSALPDAWAIYVYGSFSRGDEWPKSDLDLAVLLPAGQVIPDVFGLMGTLSEQVKREVDLVDLRKVGDVLRREVLAGGRALFISRPESVLAWEGTAMSRYAHHREEIRDILADFKRTGIGYGR